MKTVLVTGANGNLGRALVKLFSERGWMIIAVVSPHSKGDLFTGLSNVEVYRADAAAEADVQLVYEQIMIKQSRVDAAVLTIGGYAGGSIQDTTTEQIREMMQLNFFTAWHFAKCLFGKMMDQQNGHIVLIGSQPGIHLTEGTQAVAYSIAKTAVAKLAALLNEAGRNRNVFCHLVSPAILDTPQNRKAMPAADFGRWQKPEKVAEEIFNAVNR